MLFIYILLLSFVRSISFICVFSCKSTKNMSRKKTRYIFNTPNYSQYIDYQLTFSETKYFASVPFFLHRKLPKFTKCAEKQTQTENSFTL